MIDVRIRIEHDVPRHSLKETVKRNPGSPSGGYAGRCVCGYTGPLRAAEADAANDVLLHSDIEGEDHQGVRESGHWRYKARSCPPPGGTAPAFDAQVCAASQRAARLFEFKIGVDQAKLILPPGYRGVLTMPTFDPDPTDPCWDCGKGCDNPDIAEVSQIRTSVRLCTACYRARKNWTP